MSVWVYEDGERDQQMFWGVSWRDVFGKAQVFAYLKQKQNLFKSLPLILNLFILRVPNVPTSPSEKWHRILTKLFWVFLLSFSGIPWIGGS